MEPTTPMTWAEIEDLRDRLADGDSNDEEITGLSNLVDDAWAAGQHRALLDIASLLDSSLSGDGWDIEVLEWIDAHLARHGIRTANVEDHFLCDRCGRVGNIDDMCADGEDCPDEDCSGTTVRIEP